MSADAVERIRRRGEEVRREEFRTAIDRLEAQGELTDGQRAAVEELSERLVDRLLGVAERQLDSADEAAVEVAVELLG